MRNGLFLVTILTLISIASFAQSGEDLIVVNSQQMAPFAGGERDDGVAMTINGIAYFGTGNNKFFEVQKDWWQYNHAQDRWIRKSDIPGLPVQYAIGFDNSLSGYLFGGIRSDGSFSDNLLIYDSSLDSWRVESTPLRPRAQAAGFKIGTTFYVGGGRNDSLVFHDFWKYDIIQSKWTELPSLPFGPRYEMASYSIGSDGYLCLGADSSLVFNDVWQYNSIAREWSRLDDFNGAARTYATAASMQNGALLFGGQTAATNLVSEVYQFVPDHGSWELVQSLEMGPVRGVNTFTINSTCYVVGGLTANYTRVSDVFRIECEESDREAKIIIGPNPARTYIQIYLEQPILGEWLTFELIDAQGRRHLSEQLYTRKSFFEIDIGEQRNGVYFASLRSNSARAVQKVVVMK